MSWPGRKLLDNLLRERIPFINSWSIGMLNLRALSLAVSLVYACSKGVNGGVVQCCFWRSQKTWAMWLWFIQFKICNMKGTQVCSCVSIYLTKCSTKRYLCQLIRNVRSAAPSQHHLHWKNSLFSSPSPTFCWDVTVFWIIFFLFSFSIRICLKDYMNKSCFSRWVTVHYQHFNDFNYLLDNGRTGGKKWQAVTDNTS